MHYPPPHHQESNYENIVALMQTYPLATIITAKNDVILSTHTPWYIRPMKALAV